MSEKADLLITLGCALFLALIAAGGVFVAFSPFMSISKDEIRALFYISAMFIVAIAGIVALVLTIRETHLKEAARRRRSQQQRGCN